MDSRGREVYKAGGEGRLLCGGCSCGCGSGEGVTVVELCTFGNSYLKLTVIGTRVRRVVLDLDI